MAKMSRTTALWMIAVGMAMTSLACPGRHRPAAGAKLGQVAGVLPYAFSDETGQQPSDAFLCYSDADCEVVQVRNCCPDTSPTYLAVNHAAAKCIGRYHQQQPCPADPNCPTPDSMQDNVPPPPSTVCAHNRCESVEAATP